MTTLQESYVNLTTLRETSSDGPLQIVSEEPWSPHPSNEKLPVARVDAQATRDWIPNEGIDALLSEIKDMLELHVGAHPHARIGVHAVRAKEKSVTFVPRTDLARRLWELRQKIVASGRPLLAWADLETELSDRRGERGLGEER